MNIFDITLSLLIALLSAVISILWSKADKAEKTAEANKLFLTHITRTLDKTDRLTERLASLEASVQVEIKNLSVSIKRLESAVLRISHTTNHER